MLLQEQRQYLEHGAHRDGRRWAYTDADRGLIDQLVRMGMLEAAPGECLFEPARRIEDVQFGQQRVPMRGRLLSLYRLTDAGHRALQLHRAAAAN